MRVRAVDGNNDWTYGAGQNNYKTQKNAVAQNIQTRLSSFLGNCFFDLGGGINWFGFLGGKDQLSLNLAISAVILNTAYVTSLLQVSLVLNPVTRKITIKYTASTSFGIVSNTVVLATNFLTTQDGDPLSTESGESILG